MDVLRLDLVKMVVNIFSNDGGKTVLNVKRVV
jgi:hypothetical protein